MITRFLCRKGTYSRGVVTESFIEAFYPLLLCIHQSGPFFQYSADNEAERQRVELQAEHVRSQMTSRQQYQQSRQPAPIPPQRRMDHPQQQQQQQQQEQHQQHQQRPQYAPMERLLHDSAAGVVDRALSHSGPSGLNASMFNQVLAPSTGQNHAILLTVSVDAFSLVIVFVDKDRISLLFSFRRKLPA